MRTLEQKRQLIVMSDEELEMMRYELGDMQRAVEMLPSGDGESFGQTLAECQKVFAELCARFASLKQESSDEEARQQEEEDSGEKAPEQNSGQRAAEQEEEEQPRENWRM
jgi:hypothetical protein